MARITEEQYELAYEYGKKVASGKMAVNEGAEEVSKQTGMNEASASYYVYAADAMIQNTDFKKDINEPAAEYYLVSIKEDFGEEGLENAVSSLERFVDYYEDRSGQKRPGMRKLIDKYKRQSSDKITPEQYKSAYEYGNEFYFDRMTKSEAAAEVITKTGMNKMAAEGYVTAACNMIKGIRFTRSINKVAAEYYLISIKRDFGDRHFRNAVSSLEQSVDYYEDKTGKKQPGMRKLIEKYGGQSRDKITPEQYKSAYEYGKEFYFSRMTKNEAAAEVSAQTGLKEASAQMYVYAVRSMIKGSVFKWGMSREAFEYSLKRIKEDFGEKGFEKAISSLEQFVEHHENRNDPRPNTKELIEKYKPKNNLTKFFKALGGKNLIVYGAPGSGKSHRIDKKTQGKNPIRTVFHAEYQNADFVGGLKPHKENNTHHVHVYIVYQ